MLLAQVLTSLVSLAGLLGFLLLLLLAVGAMILSVVVSTASGGTCGLMLAKTTGSSATSDFTAGWTAALAAKKNMPPSRRSRRSDAEVPVEEEVEAEAVLPFYPEYPAIVAVDLGSAMNFAILTSAGITTTPGSSITGTPRMPHGRSVLPTAHLRDRPR